MRFTGVVLAAVLATSNVALAQEVEDYSETIGSGGLGIGGATGRGQVYVGGRVTGFSRLMDITFGAQAGGQSYRQIIFFENQAAYDRFTSGKFEFDASASAVAVTASAQASAGTQGASAAVGVGSPNTGAGVGYVNGMQTFTVAEGGLMYAATIGGQRYNFRPAN
jgi:lipid-binding SYLF domain-containing protein